MNLTISAIPHAKVYQLKVEAKELMPVEWVINWGTTVLKISGPASVKDPATGVGAINVIEVETIDKTKKGWIRESDAATS